MSFRISTLGYSSTIVNNLFPVGKNSLFSLPTNMFSLEDSITSELLSILKNIEDNWSNYVIGSLRGTARENNDYKKYLAPYNNKIKELAFTIVDESDSNDEKMYKLEQWVINEIPYEYDNKNYGQDEYWSTPEETLRTGSGDCIANYEEIWTKSGLTKVGDLKVGTIVLSYDFNKQEYCYKPITKIWEKGSLSVYRVTFRNGTWVDVTEDHPFWTRRTQKPNPYIKTKLRDIDLTRWYKRKVPCVKKLPYKIKDIEWLTKDLCFVVGHFLAEGDCDKYHVRTSGHNLPENIIPILNKHKIPYSIATSNNGVPYLSFLNSRLKKYLRTCKVNSFNINIPEEIFYLPEDKLQALIDGHFLGDRHFSAYASNSNKEKTYSTSSYQLAYDLQRIHLQLGIPIYMWLQMDHKGAGNKPIWRLSYNTNSRFSKDFGYKDISEVSIKKYEYIGNVEVRDFEIKDTHTFINKFGILLHNCEDQAFLLHSLALNAGVDPDRLRTYGGLVRWQNENGGLSAGGHAWTAYKTEANDRWVILDATFFTTDAPFSNRLSMEKNLKYSDDYFFVNLKHTVDTPYSNGIRNPDEHRGYNTGFILDKYI